MKNKKQHKNVNTNEQRMRLPKPLLENNPRPVNIELKSVNQIIFDKIERQAFDQISELSAPKY